MIILKLNNPQEAIKYAEKAKELIVLCVYRLGDESKEKRSTG